MSIRVLLFKSSGSKEEGEEQEQRKWSFNLQNEYFKRTGYHIYSSHGISDDFENVRCDPILIQLVEEHSADPSWASASKQFKVVVEEFPEIFNGAWTIDQGEKNDTLVLNFGIPAMRSMETFFDSILLRDVTPFDIDDLREVYETLRSADATHHGLENPQQE